MVRPRQGLSNLEFVGYVTNSILERVSVKTWRVFPASRACVPASCLPRPPRLGRLRAMREQFRAWTEKLETFLLEVIVEEGRGAPRRLGRPLPRVGWEVFQPAIKTRRFLYNVRILCDSTLGVQVIAVGN